MGSTLGHIPLSALTFRNCEGECGSRALELCLGLVLAFFGILMKQAAGVRKDRRKPSKEASEG